MIGKVLIIGDGPVALGWMHWVHQAGLPMVSYILDSHIREGEERGADVLADLAGLDIKGVTHVVSAFSSEKGFVRTCLQMVEKRVGSEAVMLVSALDRSATETASWLQWGERVVGYGVLPPMEKVTRVEITQALQTDETVFEQAAAFVQSLGLYTEGVKDGSGLVWARILCLIINEAAIALTEGISSAHEIDLAMRFGTNYPMGPLEWADLIGIDQVYGVLVGLLEEQGEDRYRPAPILRRMVLAGHLGKHTGQGFYRYEDGR